jgi:hypothetical protein
MRSAIIRSNESVNRCRSTGADVPQGKVKILVSARRSGRLQITYAGPRPEGLEALLLRQIAETEERLLLLRTGSTSFAGGRGR